MITNFTLNFGKFKDGDISYKKGNKASSKRKRVFIDIQNAIETRFTSGEGYIKLYLGTYIIVFHRNDNVFTPNQLTKFSNRIARLMKFKTNYEVTINIIETVSGGSYLIMLESHKLGWEEPLVPTCDAAIYVTDVLSN